MVLQSIEGTYCPDSSRCTTLNVTHAIGADKTPAVAYDFLTRFWPLLVGGAVSLIVRRAITAPGSAKHPPPSGCSATLRPVNFRVGQRIDQDSLLEGRAPWGVLPVACA